MLPKLTCKIIFYRWVSLEIFQIGFLIHFSDWNLFPFIPIYLQLGNISWNISGNISGNISRGIDSREFNNPTYKYIVEV